MSDNQDNQENEEPAWKSTLFTLGTVALALTGFGLLGTGSVTGQATGGEQVGCGGAYYDEDSGQIVEAVESPSSSSEALKDIRPFFVKPDLSSGLMASDYETQVSASSSGTLVAVSFSGIRDEDVHHVKLVQAGPENSHEWFEVSTLDTEDLQRLGVEFDPGLQVIEDNTVYSTLLSGKSILKYFKSENRWYTLTEEEVGPYLAGVGRHGALRLFRELSELKPITVGSLAIKEVASSVMSAQVTINVSNYSYVATKVIAVALDIGMAIIIPDCGLGYRLELLGDAFTCEACQLNSKGEPNCSFESSKTLNEESEIPKPKDVFMKLEQVLKWSPKQAHPGHDLVDPRRTTFP